jgi:hypothetical protein
LTVLWDVENDVLIALMMEAVITSETSVNLYRAARRSNCLQPIKGLDEDVKVKPVSLAARRR